MLDADAVIAGVNSPLFTLFASYFRLFELPIVTVKIQQRILTSVLSERCVLPPYFLNVRRTPVPIPRCRQSTCPLP